MAAFVKYEMCDKEISGERCEFAAYKSVIDGEERSFCCKRQADKFEKTRSKDRNF